MEVGTLWGPETTVVAGTGETVVATVAVDEHASETTKHRSDLCLSINSKYLFKLLMQQSTGN